jgi:SAM-dependent methyltransferase
MTTVSEHYEKLLAEYYSWMFGDFEARVEANRRFFDSKDIVPGKANTAVDLGAGPGFQSIALARLGFTVTAIDQSQKLLDELKQRNEKNQVSVVRDDIMNAYRHCPAPVELIVCMGDTLPHLDTFQNAGILFDRSARSLLPGGKFVLTFRDLTMELKGLERFIPVRSDADTIFTCFLEYGSDHVQVHDLVYERKNDNWQFRKSSYRKLRISLEWTVARLKTAGLAVKSSEKDKGMITIIAEKAQ